MKISDPKKVLIKSLEDGCGLTAYSETLKLYDKDVSTDTKYQKNFINYYRVRRDKEWLEKYFKFMQDHKNDKDLTFETILRYLSGIAHKVRKSSKNPNGMATSVEVSFSSKMLATIYPDKYPIWDSQVMCALGISVDKTLCGEEKIQNIIDAYSKLTKEIEYYIASDEGKECMRLFDEVFPNYRDISSFKKIDFYLWNKGGNLSK